MKTLAKILLLLFCAGAARAAEYINSPVGREVYYDPYNEGVDAHLHSRLGEACGAYSRAAEAALKLDDAYSKWEYARAITLRAAAHHARREYSLAEKYYLESLAYARKHGLYLGSMAQSGLGRIYLERNQPQKAGLLLKEACELEYAEIGRTSQAGVTASRDSLAAAISDLGRLNEQLGNRQKAEVYFLTAVKIFKDTAAPGALKVIDAEQMDSFAIILYRTGQFYRGGERPEAGATYYARALAAFESWRGLDGRPALKARALEYRGRTLRALGRDAEGLADLRESSALYRQVKGKKTAGK
ncbi:MAG: hypothetical protein A2X32_08680 [Elusimicrobia bacterium GWC2_64_44]|nr:MAG: hypothetical protein A2X32_08680 [Elusimicrobia bacterium GWC2_64_44]